MVGEWLAGQEWEQGEAWHGDSKRERVRPVGFQSPGKSSPEGWVAQYWGQGEGEGTGDTKRLKRAGEQISLREAS